MPANPHPLVILPKKMYRFGVHGLLLLAFCLLSLLHSTSLWSATEGIELVIVKSSDNAYFDETIATMTAHLSSEFRARVIMADAVAAPPEPGHGRRMYVTLGAEAANAVRAIDTSSALVSAYLTLEQYQLLDIDSQFGVLLDQPLQRYLAFCKLMLNLDSVGIISHEAIDPDSQLLQALDQFQLTLNQYQVDADNKLLPVLRDLLNSNDALLMLPRQAIYNRDSLQGVLMTSYRMGKPAISFSPAHVKSGALAAIYSSPVDIGRHLALVLNQQRTGTPTSPRGYEYARFYTISKNRRVAQALRLSLPDEGKIRSRLDRVLL